MNSYLLSQDLETLYREESITALEQGRILFFPKHYYPNVPASLCAEQLLDSRHKNISYDYKTNKLGAFNRETGDVEQNLMHMLSGYAEFAIDLIAQALPTYKEQLQWGRTSFRPAQIDKRITSKRKDDTRLHVDSFAASPVNGLRILRVFCNINPNQEPRVWQVGEPFNRVLEQFAPKLPVYSPVKAQLLKLIKATKKLRSPYDHYMLHLHDAMKLDDKYQAQAERVTIEFPALSSWIVFTDHVSHAALSGQYVLEQTFYLPVTAMKHPDLSPLHSLQQLGRFRVMHRA